MLDNITGVQWFLFCLSCLVCFGLGVGSKFIFKIVIRITDRIVEEIFG